jgi:hypothetical protein
MANWRTSLMAPVLLFLLSSPAPVPAAERCSAHIRPATGEVAISAVGVGANPRWGPTPGATTQPFADEAACLVGTRLRNCGLGAPGTLAAKTPPPLCAICVGDDGLAPACCVEHIRGCTPGVRIADGSFPAGDPRLAAGGGAIDADTLGGYAPSEFALLSDLPSISYSSTYSISRHNSPGTSSVVMTSTTRSICFLTSAAVEDTDGTGEWAECGVIASAGTWRLQARLGANQEFLAPTDSDAWCEARCLVWE